MLPRPLVYAVVIAVTCAWVFAVVADVLSETYDAQGVHLIFGGVVGGLIGLSRRSDDDGGAK